MVHMTETEKDDILKVFEEMDIKPDGKTPDELKKLMTQWVKTENKSVETKTKHAATVAISRNYHQPVRLAGIFSGDPRVI